MDELGKVKRVIEKQAPVTEVLLVIDATTGQNGLVQARVFSEVVDVTGIVLTKLDGSAKGGIVVSVQRELGVPGEAGRPRRGPRRPGAVRRRGVRRRAARLTVRMAALVSVVLDPGHDDELRAVSLASVETPDAHRLGARRPTWRRATGEYVAFLDAGDSWVPERLDRLVATADAARRRPARGQPRQRRQGGLPHAGLGRRGRPGSSPSARCCVGRRRDRPRAAGRGVAARLPDAQRHRGRAGRRGRRTPPVPGPPARAPARRPATGATSCSTGTSSTGPRSRPGRRRPGSRRVIVPTYDDAELTTACVESLLAGGRGRRSRSSSGTTARRAEVGRGARRGWPARFDRVRVAPRPENHGFALGNNLGVARVRRRRRRLPQQRHHRPAGLAGAAARGPRPTPTCSAPSRCCSTRAGTIQSAGVAFPTTGGLPHTFLRGFPAEDAAGVDGLRFHALTGAALALRRADARRPARLRPGLHQRHGGRRPVPPAPAATRPGHFRVVDRQPGGPPRVADPGPLRQAPGQPRRLPRPLAAGGRAPRRRRRSGPPAGCAWSTTRSARPGTASPPRLPDPAAGAGPRGPSPGHRQPQAALGDQEPGARRTRRRALGRHPLRRRPWPRRCASTARRSSSTGAPSWTAPPAATTTSCSCCAAWSATTPVPEQVSLLWVISHPDDVTADEARGYDRVARRGRAVGRATGPRVGAARRAAAAGHRPGAVPPRRGELPARGARGAVRRQLAPAAPPGRAGRARGRPTAGGLRRPLVRPGPRRGGPRPVDPQRPARRGVPLAPASSSTTTTTTCAPTASSPTGSSTPSPAARASSPTTWPGWPSCSARRSRSTRPRRPGPARHPRRPRLRVRRRRHPPGRRRPGPHRALLRGPRRPPRRGRPRGPGATARRDSTPDYPDDRIANDRARSSGSATRSRLRSNRSTGASGTAASMRCFQSARSGVS